MNKKFVSMAAFLACLVINLSPTVSGQTAFAPAEEGGLVWYFVFAVIAAAGAVFWMLKQRQSRVVQGIPKGNGINYEWKPEKSEEQESEDTAEKADNSGSKKRTRSAYPSLHGIDIDDVKEKMNRIRFQRLPINRLDSLSSPRPFNALPEGDEEELLKAIEESDVEFVEDEQVREAALDALAGFRTRNSVEAIAQMATYDLSSSLRSKAVGILTDIDHESVFESVILSCADPTRGVRAAGAKALFKLSFNRTDAWLRLAECADQYRVSQAAKAAIEADFVGRSLERLVHKDIAYAGEALALLALLIKAGETDELLDFLLVGEKKDVKLALLRVFRIVGDAAAIEELRTLVVSESLTDDDILDEARSVVGVPEAVGSEQ
ncbi:MAG TPA: hypothetical protein VMM38_08460 [Aridibacter sp.]|nr:hypothetical protein [Aridibacter sp.]